MKDVLEHTVLQLEPSQKYRILVKLLSDRVHRMDIDTLFNTVQHQWLFFFYALCNLPLSLRETNFLGPVDLSSKTKSRLLHRSLPPKVGSEAIEQLGERKKLKNIAESSQPAEPPHIKCNVATPSKDLADDVNIDTRSDFNEDSELYPAAPDVGDTKNIKVCMSLALNIEHLSKDQRTVSEARRVTSQSVWTIERSSKTIKVSRRLTNSEILLRAMTRTDFCCSRSC